MGIELALLAGGYMAYQGYQSYQNKQQAKRDNSLKQDAIRAQAQSKDNIGNLTKDEASTSASKKMFREGLYFTSPTGLQSGGTRGRSRLFGS